MDLADELEAVSDDLWRWSYKLPKDDDLRRKAKTLVWEIDSMVDAIHGREWGEG
jgi:hypothetical protein